MPSPFPGMDPYLEHPARWPGFHNRLIAELDRDLSPRLRPRYFVALEERVYLAESPEAIRIPDAMVLAAQPRTPGNGARHAAGESQSAARGSGVHVLVATVPAPTEVREWYLEIRDAATEDIVTLIEVLSPTNKAPGRGRQQYEAKRYDVLGTFTNLVEIDLLRAGQPMPAQIQGQAEGAPVPGDYRVLIARARQRPRAEIYTVTVRNSLPTFPVPLLPDDSDVHVDLQRLVQTVYDTSSYDLRLDYTQPPVPPLSAEDAAWADALLRERGRR